MAIFLISIKTPQKLFHSYKGMKKNYFFNISLLINKPFLLWEQKGKALFQPAKVLKIKLAPTQ
jgi:hypothetical protein